MISDSAFRIPDLLFITGLVLYLTNHIIGWLLYFKKIKMSKRTHQVFFAAIIVNLVILLFFLNFLSRDFIHCSLSLILMLILPFGKKGGKYHITISTLGIIFYLILIFNQYIT